MILSNEQLDAVIDLRTGGDWSLDLCFAGLVSNLGHSRVIDIPYKAKHREWHNHTESSWGLERRTLGHTDENHLIPEMYDLLRDGLLREGAFRRVWLDERMESFQAYRDQGFYDAKVPVVVVAGHDRFWNHSPEFVASLYGDRLEAMLLDNWYDRYTFLPFKARRIGWSCNFDHYWTRPEVPPEKHIDVCFVGYNSHPDRARFVDHVERRWGHLRNHIYLERQPDSFDNFMPKHMLFDIMSRARVCLNLRGAADRGKTLRAYEIPYVGSFMASQEIDDPGMMEDFVGGEHCLYFNDEDELDEVINFALRHPISREQIAIDGHDHAVTTLSVRSRWASVLKWLDGD